MNGTIEYTNTTKKMFDYLVEGKRAWADKY